MARLSRDRLARMLQIRAQTLHPFSGFCFRCVKPKFANRHDVFSGQGSLYAPGRFHVKGAFLIAYANTNFQGAQWEFANTARSQEINVAELLPVTILSARLELSKTLDLTDDTFLVALGVTLEEIHDSV